MVNKGKVHLAIIMVFIVAMFISGGKSVSVRAAAGIAETPGLFAKSGSNIYYGFHDHSYRGCIYKYNLKTGKSKKIYSSKDGNYGCISIKGKYLYAEKGENHIDADGNTYFRIYRMKKNGKSARFLDYGRSPVIINNWIYYIREKKAKENGEPYSYYSGYIYKMKLNGSSKKKVCKAKHPGLLFRAGNKIVYSREEYPTSKLYSLKGKAKSYHGKMNRPVNCIYEMWSSQSFSAKTVMVRSGGYLYYALKESADSGAASLHREKVKGGNTKGIYYDWPDYEISWFDVRDGYVMMYCQNGDWGGSALVLMKADGTTIRTIQNDY